MLGVVKLNSLRDICFILPLRGRVQIHSSHLSCFGYARSSRFKPRSPPHHISLYIPTIQHSLSKQSFARWNLWLKYLHYFLFILQFYTNVSLPLHCCFSLSLSLCCSSFLIFGETTHAKILLHSNIATTFGKHIKYGFLSFMTGKSRCLFKIHNNIIFLENECDIHWEFKWVFHLEIEIYLHMIIMIKYKIEEMVRIS